MCCIAGLIALNRCSQRTIVQQSSLPPPSAFSAFSATVLLGEQPRSAFGQLPFKHWFDSIYRGYTANAGLLKNAWTDEQVDVFMGTWCGDSRREVPQFLKIMDSLGIPPQKVRIICTKSGNPGHKTSPGREEQGLYIFRVPTFIVRKNGREIGRIVESPVQSLEKDLLAIIRGQPYEPNYAAGDRLRRLFEVQSPGKLNEQLPVLAEKVRPVSKHDGELNGFGAVLLSAGDMEHAITAFRVNTALYPANPDVWGWLAEGYRRNHDNEKAMAAYRKLLELSPGLETAQLRLDSLKAL